MTKLLREKILISIAFVCGWTVYSIALTHGTKGEAVATSIMCGLLFGYVFYWYKSHEWYE